MRDNHRGLLRLKVTPGQKIACGHVRSNLGEICVHFVHPGISLRNGLLRGALMAGLLLAVIIKMELQELSEKE